MTTRQEHHDANRARHAANEEQKRKELKDIEAKRAQASDDAMIVVNELKNFFDGSASLHITPDNAAGGYLINFVPRRIY